MNLVNIYLFNDDYYFIFLKNRWDDVIKLLFIEF